MDLRLRVHRLILDRHVERPLEAAERLRVFPTAVRHNAEVLPCSDDGHGHRDLLGERLGLRSVALRLVDVLLAQVQVPVADVHETLRLPLLVADFATRLQRAHVVFDVLLVVLHVEVVGAQRRLRPGDPLRRPNPGRDL